MRRANGTGSVVKLSGNRRKPFAVRITTGWTDKGYPIYEILDYVETREKGLQILDEYNRNPYDVNLHNATFNELHEAWQNSPQYQKLSGGLKHNCKTGYNYCKDIGNKRYKDLRVDDFQGCINKASDKSSATQGHIKNLFYHLDRYAYGHQVITHMYYSLLTIDPPHPAKKIPFTDKEIQIVKDNLDYPWADIALTMLYGGWRIGEVRELLTANVDLDNEIIQGGIKTAAGKDRIVPIHPVILPIIKKRVELNNKYLFGKNDKRFSQCRVYGSWHDLMDHLQIMRHTPHECRHTFRTRLDNANANQVCIDLLMGHASKSIGQRVYTHKTLEQLRKTILLLD